MHLPVGVKRDLTLSVPVTGVDDYNDTVVTGWTDTGIRGCLEQRTRALVSDDGRAASVTEWLLVTDFPDVTVGCRVTDGAVVAEVTARPWPVWVGRRVHHWEATVRLVEG